MLTEKEKVQVIVDDTPCFDNEDGELFYNLGNSVDEGAKICRKVLEATGRLKAADR